MGGVAAHLFRYRRLLPLLLALRRRLPREAGRHSAHVGSCRAGAFAGGGNKLQLLLMLAGVACCIAMAMPQVHIVADCTDLGYGPARGAEMLSLMFGTGIISRLSFCWIADRIGPAPALLISSSLQAASLLAYFGTNGLDLPLPRHRDVRPGSRAVSCRPTR